MSGSVASGAPGASAAPAAPAAPAAGHRSVILTIAALTARGMLGRRRSLLLGLLALLPVGIAVLVRLSGRAAMDDEVVAVAIMDRLIVTTLLPIVGLVFGTAVLGAELEDGTAIFLLIKPIDRWRIVLAKLIVAVGLSIVFVSPAAFVAGAILGVGGPGLGGAIGAAVGTAVGATVYATVFFALSLVTGRALALGLIYVLVWEGVLATLLAGIRALSIRQYTLAITGAITHPGTTNPDLLDLPTALILSAIAIGVGAFVAVRRLRSFQIGQADD